MTKPLRVAIVGAGPAACTLASLLAQRGWQPVVFDDGRRPEMLVGESLIPAVVPLLRRLEIEERVAAVSQYKPGVSLLHDQSAAIHFNFAPVAPWLPTYAYNVDRRTFDALLKVRAAELGAEFIPRRAGVIRGAPGSGRELELDVASLAAAPSLHGRQPDLLVDATGRTRHFARLLEIGADRGPREDMAYFAHYDNFQLPEPHGQVLINRLSGHGWSWRIPLRDKMSFGIVVPREAAGLLGTTAEERLENVMHGEPLLCEAARDARRISPAAMYANYQLLSHRSHGPGWVAAGDSFGFVDPMLSSGLFLAMEGAARLDAALAAGHGLQAYDAHMREWYRAWARLIAYFYDGRLFSLAEAGHQARTKRPNVTPGWIDRMVNKHIACMSAGALTRSFRSWCVLRAASHLLVWGVSPPAQLAIR